MENSTTFFFGTRFALPEGPPSWPAEIFSGAGLSPTFEKRTEKRNHPEPPSARRSYAARFLEESNARIIGRCCAKSKTESS